jgi:hypothetical protein
MVKRTIIQKLALIYALLFFLVVAIGYVPAFVDDQGVLFGLFEIELKDDILHFASAVWALLAGLHSFNYSKFYFKVFGLMYTLDGVLGLLTGSGYLDGGIFFNGFITQDLFTRVAANIPHLFIGGIAIIIGFFIAKKYEPGVKIKSKRKLINGKKIK